MNTTDDETQPSNNEQPSDTNGRQPDKASPSWFSFNKRLQQANRLKTVSVIVVLIALGGAVKVMLQRPPSDTKPPEKTNNIHFVGPISQEWGHKTMQSAIFAQQLRSDVTAKRTDQLVKQVSDQAKTIQTLDKQIAMLQKQIHHWAAMSASVRAREKTTTTRTGEKPASRIHLVTRPTSPTSVTNRYTNSYQQSIPMMQRPSLRPIYTPLTLPSQPTQAKIKHDDAHIVPSGTFVKAVLLSGADANASVNGEKNTDPMLLRILDNGTLPNGHHSSLKGCFVTASIYGDISSERGQIRTELLACVRASGKVLNIPVQGTVVGSAGKNGLRGIPVMRNGKILWNAGISGGIAGLGSAAQKSQEDQSSSPLGSVSTVSGSYLSYAAYGGMKSAADQLARYYIQRAEQYHPIIQINPGSVVTIIFLKPFSLSTDQPLVGMTKPKKKQPKSDTTSTLRTTLTPQQQAVYQHDLAQIASTPPTMTLSGLPDIVPPSTLNGGSQ